jgi:hypothetical protein
MPTFAMLTRMTPGALQSPHSLEELEKKVMEHVRRACPNLEWIGSYAVFGPCDYLDIFRVPKMDDASRISALVRSYGHAHTEVWALTEWPHFKEAIRDISLKAS